MPRKDAIELFKKMGEDYKAELLSEIADDEVSVYEEGGFVDLCRGPPRSGNGLYQGIQAPQHCRGAYWRGSEKNKMLQRIYGTAFADEKSLKDYLVFLEEVKKETTENSAKNLTFSASAKISGRD